MGRRRKQEQRRAGANLWNLSDPSLSPRQGKPERDEMSKLHTEAGIRSRLPVAFADGYFLG
jgi:hypothetical protein